MKAMDISLYVQLTHPNAKVYYNLRISSFGGHLRTPLAVICLVFLNLNCVHKSILIQELKIEKNAAMKRVKHMRTLAI